MGAREQRRAGQASLRGGIAPGTHDHAGLAGAGRRGDRPRRAGRCHGDPRARHDCGADLAAARAELLVAARQGRVPHRTSRRRHARLRRARALHRDAQALRASREELLTLLRDAAQRGTSLKPPPKTDAVIAGWLALGPIAADMARNPTHAAAALAEWKRAFPNHPGGDIVLAGPPGPVAPLGPGGSGAAAVPAQNAPAPAPIFHEQIALLLPLSGRPRASAPPCATASSLRICNRIRRPVRCSKSTTPPPNPWPVPTGMPSTRARHSSWARSPKRMSPQWCRCAPGRLPSSRSISSATR